MEARSTPIHSSPPSVERRLIDPLIVTVAGIGAELTPEDQPHLPLTPEDIAEDAAGCVAAGASIYHLHVRDAGGRPTMAMEAFRAARDAIRERCDIIVQFTTGGSIGDDEPARAAPLALRPEMATLTTGSVNFGNEVFLNPLPLVIRLYEQMRVFGVLPEFEIFDAGMLASAARLVDRYGGWHHQHYDFVLGVAGGMPAWADALGWLTSKLPAAATWSATGVGRHYIAVAEEAIALGGHVRTGLEDVLYVSQGQRATSNRQLVDRVVDIARVHRRPIANPTIARQILEL